MFNHLEVVAAVVVAAREGGGEASVKVAFRDNSSPRFPSSPSIIRVPLFLLFGFSKGSPKEKEQKGSTGEPSLMKLVHCQKARTSTLNTNSHHGSAVRWLTKSTCWGCVCCMSSSFKFHCYRGQND